MERPSVLVRMAPDKKSWDVWITFEASSGKSASISVGALIERPDRPGIIAGALRDWASDRIEEHKAETMQRLQETVSADACDDAGNTRSSFG